MSKVSAQKSLHANHIDIVVDGAKIGRLQNVTISQSTQADMQYEIGNFYPVEINHNRHSGVQISASSLILRTGAQNAFADKFNDLGQLDPINLAFIDTQYGTHWVIDGAEFTNESANISANQRVTKNVTMMGLRIRRSSPSASTLANTVDIT